MICSPLWARRQCPLGWQTEEAPPLRNLPIMKISGMRRALALANVFNLLVAIYFIVISIISLVHLRWYHQLTISTKVRHIITSTTSYFAFLILLAVAIVLIAIFVIGTSKLSTKIYISSLRNQDEATTSTKNGATAVVSPLPVSSSSSGPAAEQQVSATNGEQQRRRGPLLDNSAAIISQQQQQQRLILGTNRQSIGSSDGLGGEETTHQSGRGVDSSNFCSMLLNLIAAIGLLVIIVIWLLNTGELVRDSISTQLDFAFARYQFSNRSNHYSVAIDAMQNINNCCGSLDYSDFPHQRMSGLVTGHYPGSCCGKNIYGVMARVLCTPEEIVRAKQTAGCVIVIANHYDLVSLLIVPVALASLFVCIMVMAMMTLLKGHDSSLHQQQPILSPRFVSTPDKLELNTTTAQESNNDNHRQPTTETISNH